MGEKLRGEKHLTEMRQAAAIRNGQELAEQVDADVVVALFSRRKRPLSYRAIAEQLLPDESADYRHNTAVSAIQFVVHDNIPERKRKKVSSRRLGTFLMDRMAALGSTGYSDHQRDAAKAKHKKGIPINTTGIVEGRGRTRRTPEEIAATLNAAAMPEYQRPNGGADYAKITAFINTTEHEGKPVRTDQATKRFLQKVGSGA
jgi:hypothetical protein